MTGTPKCTPLPLAAALAVGALLILLGTTVLATPAADTADDAAPRIGQRGCAPIASEPLPDLAAPDATPVDHRAVVARCMANDFLCGGCPRFTVCTATAPYRNPVDPTIICCGETFECLSSCQGSCSLACAVE